MKFSTLAILPALATVAAAPAEQEQRYPAAVFTAIDVASSDDVTVRTGPTAAVVARGSAAVLRDARVAVRGDTLFIARGSGGHARGVRFTVTLLELRSARAAGTGIVTVTAANGRPFAGEMAGTGRLVVTGIDGADATPISRGTGRVTITGGARCTVEDGATTRVTCG